MKLIVGLGNVGDEYAGTRHNVGFAVAEELARQHRCRWESDLRGAFRHAAWRSAGPPVRVLKPSTMMNRSGEALTLAVERWRVAPCDILIVLDDVNLPLGRLRLRPRGSAGGHHGLASCLDALQRLEVSRLRVGVGAEALPKDLTEFVLSPFGASERSVAEHAVGRAAEACEVWVTEGIDDAMTHVNRSPSSLRKPRDRRMKGGSP
ncbi:MAG: aminoacyl-tRNA hydrolase [Candidatus Omnitrophica bacterium]|nr:aminoacyl-tRNA hydrolase [Candidatus Omnitrophota bacterium]